MGVTVVPGGNKWSMLGSMLGQGINQGVESKLQNVTQPLQLEQKRREMQQKGLEDAMDKMGPNVPTPLKNLMSILPAISANDPTGRVGSVLYPLLYQQMMAENANKTSMPFEQTTERQPLPEFGQVGNKKLGGNKQSTDNMFFPSNVGPQEATGNMPQAATGGVKRPILSPAEMMPEAKRLAAERTANGIPTTNKEAYEEVKGINDENKLFNKEVDTELKQKITSQREYGDKAVEKFIKLYPQATDEQQAIVKRIGEDVASRGGSEAEIERTLAKEATKLKNTISNVESDLSAERSYNTYQRKLLGTQKDYESATNDLRVKLKPLLDLGLYDTSRNLLNKLGYYPEERENIINPLDNRTKTEINQIPSVKKEKGKSTAPSIGKPYVTSQPDYYKNPEEVKNNIKPAIKKIITDNKNASLVLLRKQFEDRGYDWRIFKDVLNDLVQSGEVNLNGDQFDQVKYLDSPPLNELEKILHKVNLVGR